MVLILGINALSFGQSLGEVLGNVLSTDIIAKIDGLKISSFNFRDKTVIYATDLRVAGFNVAWDNNSREVLITSPSGTSIPSKENSVVELGNVTYSDAISIDLANANDYNYLVIDETSNTVKGLLIEKFDTKIQLKNTYYLQLGKTYRLIAVHKNTTASIDYRFTISPTLSKDSFKSIYDICGAKSVIVPSNEEKGFSFPYRLLYSTYGYQHNTSRDFDSTLPELFVESANHGVDTTFEDMMVRSSTAYPWSLDIASNTKYNAFIMYAILPRISTDNQVYIHALDRQTVFGTEEYFKQFNRGNLYRIDNQVVAMQEDAKYQLAHLGVAIDKPILVGFSSASDFASRLNLLHPDLAKALVINDAPTMPFAEYNSVELKYPLGIADIQKVTGKPFNKAKFIDTPQFWTTGTSDTNDGTYFSDGWGNYDLDDVYDSAHNNLEGKDYRRAFGNEIIQRKELIRKLLVDKGFNNIQFHTYNVGHGTVDATNTDIELFLNKIIKKN